MTLLLPERIACMTLLLPERIACMTLLLPGHTGGHILSSEDLSPFLEGGCRFARSMYIMAEDSPR